MSYNRDRQMSHSTGRNNIAISLRQSTTVVKTTELPQM